MRHDDEEDPKTPHPVAIVRKRSNPAEVAEAIPIKDDERDHHRHVV